MPYLIIRKATRAAAAYLILIDFLYVANGVFVREYSSQEALDADAQILASLFQTLALRHEPGPSDENLLVVSNDGHSFATYVPPPSSTPTLLSQLPNLPNLSMELSPSCEVVSPIDTAPECMIYSFGFEFQSSDLFTVVIEYAEDIGYVCQYATSADIPENSPVPLFTLKSAAVGVQLDAVVPLLPDNPIYYINKIDDFVFPSDGPLIMLESVCPLDTEFVVLDVDRESVLSFEPDARRVDPVELMKSHFELQKTSVFCFWLQKRCPLEIKYTTPFPSPSSPEKFNILRIMEELQPVIGKKHIGFITHGLTQADAQRISFVPQVTFGCKLHDAYRILLRLLNSTADNKHMLEILKVVEYAKDLPRALDRRAKSFLFLLSYYLRIMAAHSKQELGIAVRHRFVELFDSLPQDVRGMLRVVTKGAIGPMLEMAFDLEERDGIHRYPLNPEGIILIEYRLFNYVVSPDGVTIL